MLFAVSQSSSTGHHAYILVSSYQVIGGGASLGFMPKLTRLFPDTDGREQHFDHKSLTPFPQKQNSV